MYSTVCYCAAVQAGGNHTQNEASIDFSGDQGEMLAPLELGDDDIDLGDIFGIMNSTGFGKSSYLLLHQHTKQ